MCSILERGSIRRQNDKLVRFVRFTWGMETSKSGPRRSIKSWGQATKSRGVGVRMGAIIMATLVPTSLGLPASNVIVLAHVRAAVSIALPIATTWRDPTTPGSATAPGPIRRNSPYTLDHYAKIMTRFTEAIAIPRCTLVEPLWITCRNR